MKRIMKLSIFFVFFFLFIGVSSISADVQRIYDDANLLTDEEVANLEEKAAAYYDEWQTDFIILTTNDAGGKDIKKYMGDFTDELEEEFNRTEDNMIVLTMKMETSDITINGFGLGEKYVDNKRSESIRNKITPDLSNENYYDAFILFFESSHEYLEVTPGVNPDSIFFNTFIQLAIAVVLAGVIVFFMAYNSGGRVTVSSKTYMDQENSRVISKSDRYIRKTVTRTKKPSNNNSGGGGGMTGGGRSYSGSRGKF